MTLFGSLAGLGSTASIDVDPDTGGITEQSLLELVGGGRTAAGVRVTESRSLTMPAVWRAVTLLAGVIASLPLHAYRSNGAQRDRATGSPAERALSKPHPDLTAYEWLEIVVSHLALWGNAYLLIKRDGLGRVLYMLPIHPSQVRVGRRSKPDPDTGSLAKRYKIDGPLPDGSAGRVLSDLDVLHIPGFGYDGVCGVSPIRAARQSVGLAIAAEEYGAKLFGSGSLATGVLQTDQRLTQAQADRLHERWTAKHSGMGSAHGTIVLDRGTSFHQLSIHPDDAQFLESRSFQVSEIARMFGVPPHMLMDTDKSTSWGTGIEQQTIGFVTYTLRPWISRIEARLTALLGPADVYVRFELEGLLRGDSAQRAAFYKTMREIGVFDTDEVRALEDLPPVDGGDVRHVPANWLPLGAPQGGTSGSQAPVSDPQPTDSADPGGSDAP